MTDEKLIRKCSPTLAGLKTGNLFNSFYSSRSEMEQDIREYNRRLSDRGVRMVPMLYDEALGRALIYVFRPSKLEKDLEDNTAKNILSQYGYGTENAKRCIARLAHRIIETEGFPHEIGLFLGYPSDDVKGFIDEKNCENCPNNHTSKCSCNCSSCKLVGYWKVYGDTQSATKKFRQFSKCTEVYLKQFALGSTVEKLTVRAPKAQ